MNEVKVTVNFILKGRVMYSNTECFKTEAVKYKDKKGKNRTKYVQVENPDMFEVSTMQLKDYKTRQVETFNIKIRKTKDAQQSLNINKYSYEYMISRDSCASLNISQKHWDRMSKSQRLIAHLDEICKGLNGISYTFHVFED